MARLYEYYDEDHPPMKCFMTNARWYKESGTFTPKGILWHDTGADNPWLKRYVQPDDDAPNRAELLALIGKNTYGNDWNHGGKDKSAGLNLSARGLSVTFSNNVAIFFPYKKHSTK